MIFSSGFSRQRHILWQLVFGVSIAATLSAAETGTGFLLVANKGDQTLSIVDAATGQQVATVPEDGKTGHEVAASPDGKRAFVPIYGDSGVGRAGSDGSVIRVVDLEKRAVTGTIDFGRGVRPHCAVFGPKDGLLYITTEMEKTVTIIDPATLKILGAIPTGQEQSHMLAISHDGRRGYTANVGPGTVSVLDLEKRTLLTTIPIAPVAQRITLSVDDRWAFTADYTALRLVVIDTATNTIHASIPLPGLAYGTAPTPDGRWLVVTLPSVNKVGLVDLTTMKVVRTLDVPKAPQAALVRPDGAVAYVSCDSSHQIAVIDIASWKVTKLIEVGPMADGLAWAQSRQ
jgi:DNA-binding beta-propeller fold protein YncE